MERRGCGAHLLLLNIRERLQVRRQRDVFQLDPPAAHGVGHLFQHVEVAAVCSGPS